VELAARQSQAPLGASGEVDQVQLALPLGDDPSAVTASGLPELTGAEQLRAELEVLGLDVTRHVIDFYEPFMAALDITRSRDLMGCRSRQEILIAGVKVATQTPPVRSGRRVVFVTLDDATGPLDATFFEDAQAGYASTVFHSWLLVIRGFVRRTGPRGVSLRATGCWELPAMRDAWELGGIPAVEQLMAAPAGVSELAVQGAAASRSSRPVMVKPPAGEPVRRAQQYATGFRLSPYADIKPSGGDARSAPRRLWHSSPGSSGG
jgi:error-prone DNA polymerase